MSAVDHSKREAGFEDLQPELVSHIINYTGWQGLLIVCPRVSKMWKSMAATLLAEKTEADLSMVVPSTTFPEYDQLSRKLWAQAFPWRMKDGKLTMYADNLRWILTKLTSLQKLTIECKLLYQGGSYIPMNHKMMGCLQLCSTLTELRITGMPQIPWLDGLVGHGCPKLEKLEWSVQNENDYDVVVDEYFRVDDPAIEWLKSGCPRMKSLPCFAIHSSDFSRFKTKTTIKNIEFWFDALRMWPTLEEASLFVAFVSKRHLKIAQAFADDPGEFTGKLTINAWDDFEGGSCFLEDTYTYANPDDYDEDDDPPDANEFPYLVLIDTPHVYFRVTPMVYY